MTRVKMRRGRKMMRMRKVRMMMMMTKVRMRMRMRRVRRMKERKILKWCLSLFISYHRHHHCLYHDHEYCATLFFQYVNTSMHQNGWEERSQKLDP